MDSNSSDIKQDLTQTAASPVSTDAAKATVHHALLQNFHHVANDCKNGKQLAQAIVSELNSAGFEIERMRLGIEMNHPALLAIAWVWNAGDGFNEYLIQNNIIDTPTYLQSPVRPVKERELTQVRIHLQDDGLQSPYNVVPDLMKAQLTDYLVLPLQTNKQRDDVVTFATKKKTGFTDQEIETFRTLATLLAPYAALQAERLLTQTIARIYLGKNTGDLVASGQIERGNLRFIDAAVWFSDLRGFTALSNTHSAHDVVTLLNSFFEAVDTAVRAHGGEILKLMGDAALAVFPTEGPVDPCVRALKAAQAMHAAWPEENNCDNSSLVATATYGIGLHYGHIAYGNIGATERLDFTVIGRDVNLASRLSAQCANLEASILCTRTFNERAGAQLARFGEYEIKGLPDSFELFGVPQK